MPVDEAGSHSGLVDLWNRKVMPPCLYLASPLILTLPCGEEHVDVRRTWCPGLVGFPAVAWCFGKLCQDDMMVVLELGWDGVKLGSWMNSM
jgi:hypothetical protein